MKDLDTVSLLVVGAIMFFAGLGVGVIGSDSLMRENCNKLGKFINKGEVYFCSKQPEHAS